MLPSHESGEDAVGVCGPDEGFGVIVDFLDAAVDGGLEIDNRAEDAAAEAASGELGEEAFDGVEPGGRCRGEVDGPARMSGEPGAHLRMLVGGIVSTMAWIVLPTGTCASMALRKRMNSW